MKRGHARPDLDVLPILREVAEQVAASADGDAAMASVAAGVTVAVDADIGCVFVREADGDALRVGAAHGHGRPGYERVSVVPGLRDPIAAAMATLEEQRCDDYLASEGWLSHAVALEEPWRSAWFAPLRRGTRTIGVIGAIRRRVEPFDEDERELLATLTAHAGIALDAALRADGRAAERARALETVTALALHLDATCDQSALLEQLAETTARHASARAAVFRPLESDDALAHVQYAGDGLVVPWRAGARRLGTLTVHGSLRRGGFTEEDAWVVQVAGLAAGLVWHHRDETGTARALEKLKSHILNLASHELGTPLTLIRGYLSLMADGTIRTDPPAATFVPALLAKVNQMSLMITEMLETARLEEGRLELRLAERDLRQVVRDAVESLRPVVSERHRLVLDEDPRPVLAMLDAGRINTIVTNLLDNAVKYSPAGGPVEVSVRRRGSLAAVSVADRGLGIAPEDVPRLFSRFGRLLTGEHGHIAGNGLGLYLCRELALMHGGDITVQSKPGRGSTFTLLLPPAG